MGDTVRTLIVVEDEPAHAQAIVRSFKEFPEEAGEFRLLLATDIRSCRQFLKDITPSLLLIDLNLPDGKATDILGELPQSERPYPIIVITSQGDERSAVAAMKAGALDYVVKSTESLRAMPQTVLRALREWELLEERTSISLALRESEVQHRQLFQQAVSGIALHEMLYSSQGEATDFIYIDANPAFELHTGLKVADVLGKRVSEVIPGTLQSGIVQTYAKVVATGEPLEFEFYAEPLKRHYVINAYRTSKDHFATIFFDITGRMNAEKALMQREAELAAIYSHIPFTLALVDARYRVRRINDTELLADGMTSAAAEGHTIGLVLGCHLMTGGDVEAEQNRGCEECTINTPITGTFTTQEGVYQQDAFLLRRTNGKATTLALLLSTVPLRIGDEDMVLLCLQDITQMRGMRESLRHAQKMESIGTLAAGVAHDFNNILTAIVNFTTLARKRHLEDSTCVEYLDEVLLSARRATEITRALLTYGRKQPSNLRPDELTAIVRQSLVMIRSVVRKDIQLEWEFSELPLPILADRTQIEQVILNLVLNAQDASREQGKISLSTGIEHSDLTGERYCAVLEVSDSGCGIEPQLLEHIFEPFFTTKDVDRGTGLGLSIAYGIIQQHRGSITVQSIPGEGTTFTVKLPCESMENPF